MYQRTAQQTLAAEVAALEADLAEGAAVFKYWSSRLMDRVWHNPNATPTQIFDALGPENFTLLFFGNLAIRQTVATFDLSVLMPTAPGDFIFDGTMQIPDGRGGLVGVPRVAGLTFTLAVTGPEGAMVTVAGVTRPIEGGVATFAGLAEGAYPVTAALEGYEDAPVTAVVHRNTTAACGLTLIPPPPPPPPPPPVDEEEPPVEGEGVGEGAGEGGVGGG